MRVLQINTVIGTGSTGRIAAGLDGLIKQAGHESAVAFGRGNAPEGMNAYRIGTDTDMYLHGAFTRITDRHGFASKRATQKFVSWAKGFHPDVVHLHNIHGYYLHIPTLFQYLHEANIPVVWTLHDCWSFTGHCSHYDYIGCEKWKNGCFSCPQKAEYPKSILADASKKNYADKKRLFSLVPQLHIVTPSQWLADQVKASFLGKFPVTVVPNGIDLKRFAPPDGTKRKEETGRTTLLGVANIWSERKGFHDFIRLSEILGDKYRIVLIGVNDAQKAQLPTGIEGLFRTNSIEQLADFYSRAAIYVNPTQEETFSMTNLEALACGTPVVTYMACASPEILTPECGIAVERGNVEAIAQAIETIFFERRKAIHFSMENCRQRALQYEHDACFMRYLNLYGMGS